MRNLSRDPFARHNIVRRTDVGRTVDRTQTGDSYGERLYRCTECGQVRYTKAGHPFTYRYGVDPDAGRLFVEDKGFCSKSCHDCYTR